MDFREIVFSGHALRRMFERRVGRDEVVEVIATGTLIQDYPDDYPYPSRLMLGFPGGEPLHVLVAVGAERCTVVTVYRPDPNRWNPGYSRRRAL